jgi:hypothetical protein
VARLAHVIIRDAIAWERSHTYARPGTPERRGNNVFENLVEVVTPLVFNAGSSNLMGVSR